MNGLQAHASRWHHRPYTSHIQFVQADYSACSPTSRIIMTIPYLVYCTPGGEIREERRLRALAFGNQPLESSDLLPIPDGVTLSMMPDRLAVGAQRSGALEVIAKERGWAAAALLPIGYTRSLLPAYEKVPDTEPLPFFGYSAVAGMN